MDHNPTCQSGRLRLCGAPPSSKPCTKRQDQRPQGDYFAALAAKPASLAERFALALAVGFAASSGPCANPRMAHITTRSCVLMPESSFTSCCRFRFSAFIFAADAFICFRKASRPFLNLLRIFSCRSTSEVGTEMETELGAASASPGSSDPTSESTWAFSSGEADLPLHSPGCPPASTVRGDLGMKIYVTDMRSTEHERNQTNLKEPSQVKLNMA